MRTPGNRNRSRAAVALLALLGAVRPAPAEAPAVGSNELEPTGFESTEWEDRAMRITRSNDFAQDVETLFEPFTLPAEIDRKYQGMGARNVEILEIKSDDGVLRVKTRREIPAEVPRLLQKFLGEWNTVVQTEEWRAEGGRREGSIGVEIEGVPVTVGGEVSLRPRESGSVVDMDFRVRCGIPLMGKKLAEFVGGVTADLLAKEVEFLRERGEALGG